MPPLTPAGSTMTADEDSPSQFGGAYAAFYEGVAKRQLTEWLPTAPSVVLDLSGSDGHYALDIVGRGHTVVHLTGGESKRPEAQPGLHVVRGELQDLSWLCTGSFDAVLAESAALSACLAFEDSLAQIRRLLQPGGRLMLSVDSLAFGLAQLAEQGRWAELADVPAADVVLVPNGERITRCFWPEELAQILADSGFATDWIRPRTVLAPEAVSRALAADPGRLQTLVDTEARLEQDREGESTCYHLVASAARL